MLSLFRLPYWAYFIAAPAVLAFAIYFYFDERGTEAAKAMARARTAPAAVAIERYDPARNLGPAGEVQIVAQLDVARMMELTETKRGVERNRWNVAPLYPAGATDNKGPAIGVFEQHGALDEAQLAKMVVATGPFGPVLRINGIVTTDFSAQEAVRKAMANVALAPNAVIVDPFENGRAAGLAANSDGMMGAGLIAVVAVAIGLYGWFLMRRHKAAQAAEAEAYDYRPETV